jgi:hypothetical protein
MFVVIRHFLRDCVILLTGTESMQILSFGYTCIAIGDPFLTTTKSKIKKIYIAYFIYYLRV